MFHLGVGWTDLDGAACALSDVFKRGRGRVQEVSQASYKTDDMGCCAIDADGVVHRRVDSGPGRVRFLAMGGLGAARVDLAFDVAGAGAAS